MFRAQLWAGQALVLCCPPTTGGQPKPSLVAPLKLERCLSNYLKATTVRMHFLFGFLVGFFGFLTKQGGDVS